MSQVEFNGEEIARRRELHRLTQVQLAKLVGVRRTTIASWEKGEHRPQGAAQKMLREVFSLLEKNSEVDACITAKLAETD